MARRKHEDHLNHEAWAIPYADLMTLLLAFFVVMYAISSINEDKYRIVADSLKIAFGGGANATGRSSRAMRSRPTPSSTAPARSRPSSRPWPTPPCWPSMASQNRDFPLDAASLEQSSKQLGTIADNLAAVARR
jgi:chemotaxis protein MotB